MTSLVSKAWLAIGVALVLESCGGSGSGVAPMVSGFGVGGHVYALTAGSLVLQDGNGHQVTLGTGATGFTFPSLLANGSAYAVSVSVQPTGLVCTVNGGSGTIAGANVSSVFVTCAPGAESILYSFGSSATDGTAPVSGLVADANGNLYGTTPAGGANGLGSVYMLPYSAGTGFGQEVTLYSFGASATDGATPLAALAVDPVSGILYGTTQAGGANGQGSAFAVSVSTASGSPTATETVLYSFGASATDALGPATALVTDGQGNWFGTTQTGGSNGKGTVYRLQVSGGGGALAATETVLYNFGSTPTDGAGPLAPLVVDPLGNLYGTTASGGSVTVSGLGLGTVFVIPFVGGSYGSAQTLHNFGGTAGDGWAPQAGLAIDASGTLYGTTALGGSYSANGNSGGTVFKIQVSANAGVYSGSETILHSFGATAADGSYPTTGLILDASGNLYGTTQSGGTASVFQGGEGTVFEIPADATTGSGFGSLIVLYSFGDQAGDGTQASALVIDAAGNLDGTTPAGGANAAGTVFTITP